MNKKANDLTYYLTKFFTSFLVAQKGVSENTIKSYRDTFKILLKFFTQNQKINISQMQLKEFNKHQILDFLDFLEKEKKNCINTRNQRLAAIHSFCRYVQMEAPEYIHSLQEILEIPFKQVTKRVIEHLTQEAMELILKQPNVTIQKEYRDLVILSVLYDTGARVQELIDIKVKDINLGATCTVLLHGKGNKDRIVPIMSNTKKILEKYLTIFPKENNQYLFESSLNRKFSRKGISYIINKYGERARKKSNIIPNALHPHQFRHSKAMHLLQSGVNLIYIRDFLGHVDIETTEIYAQYDTETKRKAIENAYPDLVSDDIYNWQEDNDLMLWLNSL